MKKTLLFLMAAMCAVSMSAQNHLLRVWRGGEKLFETKIEENDSITFQQLKGNEAKPLDPAKATFTYDNWRNVDDIYLYLDGDWNPIYLPWSGKSSTAIPDEYLKPNEEFVIDENKDTIPRWELSFNTCYDYKLQKTYMFGLWDRKSQILRIYRYLDELGDGITYCFYEVNIETIGNSYIEPDAKLWQPSSSILKKSSFFKSKALSYGRAPAMDYSQVMPITGAQTKGQVSTGWHCFELDFDNGTFDITADKAIKFIMTGVQKITFDGTGSLSGVMETQEGSTITIPGNKARRYSGIVTAVGEGISGLSSSIANGVSVGTQLSDDSGGIGGAVAGVVTGLLGVAGSVISTWGKIKSAQEEAKDTKLKLDVKFNISADLKFQGTLTTTEGTSAFPLTIEYDSLFTNIIKNRPKKQSSRRRADSNGAEIFSIGAWNLKQQPVLYVCDDACFTSPEGDNDYQVLASFLDPSSIELMLNSQNILFDYDNIEKVSLVAYDFAFVNDEYTLSAQPYYEFYGVPQDTLRKERISLSIPSGAEGYKMFLLNKEADFQTSEKSYGSSIRKYTGIKQAIDHEELNVYDHVSSPAVSILKNTDNHRLNEIGVAVVVEIEFKDGEKRLFSNRFLPEVRTFSLAEASALKEQLQNAAAPTTVEDIALESLLFDQQKAKALRVLGVLDELCSDKYPMVRIDNVPYSKAIYNSFGTTLEGSDISYDYGYGIRVRKYIDKDNPGIVIRTLKDSRRDYYNANTAHSITWPLSSDIVHLSEYLQTLNDWDNLNSKLEQCGMYSLNHFYYAHHYALYSGYNIQTQESGSQLDGGMNNVPTDAGYIQIYYEDKDGNLTLVGEKY